MTRRETWQGRNWCHPTTRLALYLRDGLACVWCEAGIEDGVELSLDHLVPVARGGTNQTSNLLTACRSCNSRRGHKSVPAFAAYLVEQGLVQDTDAAAIERHVRNAVRRKEPRAEARRLLERRTWAEALEEVAS